MSGMRALPERGQMAERQGQQSLLPKDAARASRWAYWETLSWTADTASYILP